MEHWKLQRISAIIMIPVVILSLAYLVNITSIPHGELIEDLGSISGFVLSVAFIGFILDPIPAYCPASSIKNVIL